MTIRFAKQNQEAESTAIHSCRPCAAKAAFSMVEVLIAVALIGIVGLSTFAGISNGMAAIQFSREEVRAGQLLQEKMETIRLYSWNQLNTPGFVPMKFTAKANPTNANETSFYEGKVLITPAPIGEAYKADMVRVKVDVSWTNGTALRTRTMTTLVSRYGLQNYIY